MTFDEYALTDQVWVKYWNGTAWVTANNGTNGSLNNSYSYQAENPSITICNGKPFVAFSETGGVYGTQVYMKSWNGTSWDTEGSFNCDSSQPGVTPSLSASNNTVFAAWQETKSGYTQIYENSWDSVNYWAHYGTTQPSLNLNANKNASLPNIWAVNGTPYVAWLEDNGTANQLCVKHWNGSAWVIDSLSLNTDPATTASLPSLAVSDVLPATPYIAWYESHGSVLQTFVKAEVLNNISRVAPNYSLRLPGVKITVASGTVSGTASAKLVRTGSPDLTSTAAVKNNNTSFTYTFDFSQAAAGVYDVACADASQFTGILKQAFSILLPVVSPVAWSMHDLGQAGTQTNINNVCGLAIGDANGDNLQELYVGNQDQNLYKFTWDNSSWTCIAQTVAASQTFGRVLLADGNNNTGWQVYAGTVASNHLYSCSASWATQDIGAAYAGTAKITALASADIYNEGFTRIYAAATDGISKYGLSQFQYQYDGVTWTASDIYYPPSQANDLVAGDGNNDGTVKLYSANSGGSIYQYTVSGSTWTMGVVDTGTDIMYGVAVGDGANLGNNQVYAACKNGKLYQFRWNGSWSNQAIGQAVGNTLYAVAVSDADNDGANEVYAACGDGHVYEFKYQGTTWKTLDLGNAGTPLYTLAVGDADNDHQFEVYALGQNNHVYQFKAGLQGTATPTPVVTPTPGAPMPTTFLKINHSQINPNHGEQAVIRWIQPQNGPVTITIYNLLGDKVATLVSSQTFPAGQFNQVDWNGHTQAGKTAGSGIYILQLQAPGYQAISKVAVVK